MATVYWLTINVISKGSYFNDYLTNPNKRFQTGPGKDLGKDYWKMYEEAYLYAKNNGHIILRAKVINEKNILKIYQIWANKKVREQWENIVDPKYFTNTVPLVTYQYPLSVKRKNKLFGLILTRKKVILQAVREDHRKPGMIIGDPLKADQLIRT